MRVERSHALGHERAKQKLDGAIESLLQRDKPGGVTVQDAYKSWTGKRMDFSCKLSKGFFSTRIGGTVDVSDDRVIVDFDLPSMVTRFMGEERIRQELERRLDGLLQGA